MNFGYVWHGPGAIMVARQRKFLTACEIDRRRIVEDSGDDRSELDDVLSILRPGDVLYIHRLTYLPGGVAFYTALRRIAEADAAIHPLDLGKTLTMEKDMADALEDREIRKNKTRTAPARERKAQLGEKAKGGRPRSNIPQAKINQAIKMHADENNTLADISAATGIPKHTLSRRLREWLGDSD